MSSVRIIALLSVVTVGVACGPPSRDRDRDDDVAADASHQTDAGEEGDAGDPVDAGDPIDAGHEPDPAAQIADVRSAGNGPTSLPVDGAFVTYLKPALGSDTAGFFVQATRGGPALFVSVDPATLSPSPVAGDEVSFRVTHLATQLNARVVMALDDWQVTGQGSLDALVEDVSERSDLVSSVANYESELVSITAQVTESFIESGAGHVLARIETAGLQGEPNLSVRLATTVRDELLLGVECSFTLRGPVWRFNNRAQPSSYSTDDFSAVTCPAPELVAVTSIGPRTLRLEFSRELDPLTVSAPAFAFTGGLSASMASVDGRVVTLTTSAQTPDQSYSVTAPGSLQDVRGTGLDIASSTAAFVGYTGALLAITEVDPSVPGGLDLIELVALRGGDVSGFEVRARTGSLYLVRFPQGLVVETDDIIVVHLSPPAEYVSETTSKSQFPRGELAPTNHDDAWDLRGGPNGLSASASRVLTVVNQEGALLDAAAFTHPTDGASSTYVAHLQVVQEAGLWLPDNCGGVACDALSTPGAMEVGASWSGVGGGQSISRAWPPLVPGSKEDWSVVPSSFGAPNL